MIPTAFDSETALIRPALLAPPIACLTWQRLGEPARIASQGLEAIARRWLEDPDVLLIGHHVAYDMAVLGAAYPSLLRLIFDAYDADRVTDTMLRQQLLDIAAGTYRGSISAKGRRVVYKYGLEDVAPRCAGMRLQKDAWRLAYGNFVGLPLEEWPAKAREIQAAAPARLAVVRESIAGLKSDDVPKDTKREIEGLELMIAGDPSRCVEYPLEDARATLAVYLTQEKHAAYLKDQYRQARAYFSLYLSSAWGLRTNREGVAALRSAVEADLCEMEQTLIDAGLVRPDGSRDTKVAKRRMIEICKREGLVLIRTDAHFADGAKCGGGDDCEEHVCLDSDACERTDDELLTDYSARTALSKQLSNDIPALEGGTTYPVHTRYGLAATGRTTSSKPNIQNQSKRPGYREAFVPRPGKVFAQCDFPGLELYTWAQCCKSWFGFSKLADALNEGLDPHLWVAAIMLGISYEEAKANKGRDDVKRARQQAKPGNFGFAGGMGIPKFVTTTRKQMGRAAFEELGLTEERAKILKTKWGGAWPESSPHFQRAASLCDNDQNRANVVTLFTDRYRGAATYCAACNNGFQALGADCAKQAMWLIAKAEYVDAKSPLFGGRTVAFVHDEVIAEVDDGPGAHDAACELARLMVEGANAYLPDVPIRMEKMEPTLMRRWSKKAKPVFENGRLVPWDEAA